MNPVIAVTFALPNGTTATGRGRSLDDAAREQFGNDAFVAGVPDFDRPGKSVLVVMRRRKQVATVLVDGVA